MDWTTFLQNGLNTSLDGYIQKEITKNTPTEQIPPSAPQPVEAVQTVAGALTQNNISLGGVSINKNVILTTGAIIGAILLVKAVL